MRFNSLRALAGAALALVVWGCEPKVVPYQVTLTLDACAGPSPTEDVTHLQVRVTGEGIAKPITRVTLFTAHHLALPDIPAGNGRVIEVRGYANAPDLGGRVVSLGRSLPFDVPAVVPLPGQAPPAINIFLRRVNAFTPTSTSAAPDTCVQMATARAGHTATVLRDGKVLIAGGYQLSASDEPVSLSKAELYDPATGAFSDAPELGVSNGQGQFTAWPRAFHTATRLPDGRVLLAGGELATSGSPATPLASALIYDPDGRSYRGLGLQQARSRHAAAADPDGRVMLVGGVGSQGLAGLLEWFDPLTDRMVAGSGVLLRTEVALAPGPGGLLVAAGGTDGTTASDEVRFYKFTGNTFQPMPEVLHLREKRRAAGLAPIGDGTRLAVVAGFLDGAEAQGLSPAASSELIATQGGFAVEDGPAFAPRGDICVAALPDGRVLAVGGRSVDLFAGPQSDGSAELLTLLSTGAVTVLGMPTLQDPRYQHTCTTLPDGTVLVLGGLRDTGGNPTVLQDALIFTPAPAE